MKYRRLNQIESSIVGYLWLNGPLCCTRNQLAIQINANNDDVIRALPRLAEKGWIKKKRFGKGLNIKLVKQVIPDYIIKNTELKLEAFRTLH